MARKEIGTAWNRDNRNAMNDNFKELYTGMDEATNRAIEQIGDEFEAFKAKNDTRFLEPVATTEERDSVYPEPQHGDAVQVTGEAAYYRYEDGAWRKTNEYNPTAIDHISQQLAETSDRLAEAEKYNLQPLFVETFSSFSRFGTGVPAGVTKYPGGNYLLTVDGTKGNDYFDVTSGNIADAGNAVTWAAILEKGNGVYEGYRVMGTDGVSKVYVYPAVRESVSGVTLGNLHDGEQGQHYTAIGYRAFGQHIFNNSGYYSQRLKYIARFLGTDTSGNWKGVSAVSSVTYSRGLHPVDLTDGIIEGDNDKSLTFVTDAVDEGLEWEVPIDKNSGYFEGFVGIFSGSPVRVEFYVDDILRGTKVINREVERVVFDFSFGDKAKVRILSNTADPTTVRVGNCYWWRTEKIPNNIFNKSNDKAVYLGDSWGTYHDQANPKEIERLWKKVNPNATIINRSQGGMTTKYARVWFDEYVISEKPDIVIIEYFTNDINTILVPSNGLDRIGPDGKTYNTRVTEAEYLENLRYMVDTAINNGIQPVVVLPAAVEGDTQTLYHARYNAKLANGGSVTPSSGMFWDMSAGVSNIDKIFTDEIETKTLVNKALKIIGSFYGVDIQPRVQPTNGSFMRILRGDNGSVVYNFRADELKGVALPAIELTGTFGEQGISYPNTHVVDSANVYKIKKRDGKTLTRVEVGEGSTDGVEMKSPLKVFDAGTLPAANLANRGKIVRVTGGTGTADKVYMCIKNASESYEWKEL